MDQIKNFVEEKNPAQSGLLGQIQNYAHENNVPIISKEMSGFLSLILNLKRPKKILELGCAIGYSAILMSQFLDDNGTIITIERSKKMIELAKKNIADAKLSCIKLIEADINNVLPNMNDKFDIIFMDAAKGQYVKILPFFFYLLNFCGIIFAVDILQGGQIVIDRFDVVRRQRTIHSRMNQFIDEIFSNPNLRSNIFYIGDGVIVGQKI